MMKSAKNLIICMFIFVVLLGLPGNSWSVPALQIYIPGAEYDFSSETWIIDSYDYELWVIGAHDIIADVKVAFAIPTDEDGSIDLAWIDPALSDYGSGDVSDLTLWDPNIISDPNRLSYTDYRATYAASVPDPTTYGFGYDAFPLMGDGSSIPPHGVFPRDFFEYFVGDFGLSQTVQDFNPYSDGGFALGEIKKFDISVSGYSMVDIVAYDHIVKTNGKGRYVFSPFSHDGGSTNVIPEPASILLFASGLLGALIRKRIA